MKCLSFLNVVELFLLSARVSIGGTSLLRLHKSLARYSRLKETTGQIMTGIIKYLKKNSDLRKINGFTAEMHQPNIKFNFGHQVLTSLFRNYLLSR